MNWKEYYAKIKPGDQVYVIKSNYLCLSNCYECGINKTQKYLVDSVGHSKFGNIRIDKGFGVSFCYMPKNCLKKVLE